MNRTAIALTVALTSIAATTPADAGVRIGVQFGNDRGRYDERGRYGAGRIAFDNGYPARGAPGHAASAANADRGAASPPAARQSRSCAAQVADAAQPSAPRPDRGPSSRVCVHVNQNALPRARERPQRRR